MKSFEVELNNARKDGDFHVTQIAETSPIVEVFSAMVDGKDIPKNTKDGRKIDTNGCVERIKELNTAAAAGDMKAHAELNTLRKYNAEPKLLEEVKFTLGLFGQYQALGYDETPEVEAYSIEGEKSRFQSPNGDVVFPIAAKEKYQVPTKAISGGHVVDYRKALFGDMTRENELISQIKTDIRNKATLYCVVKLYNQIKNAVGVKFINEAAGITKVAVDTVNSNVRRFGRTNILGDYAMVSQLNGWAGYQGTNPAVAGVSEAVMERIRKDGVIDWYNGSFVVELPNQYDLTALNAAKDNFNTILPTSLLWFLPNGQRPIIRTFTRGGLTSFSGNDIPTGKIITRFDLEIALDLEKGSEHKIGLISDNTNGVPTL